MTRHFCNVKVNNDHKYTLNTRLGILRFSNLEQRSRVRPGDYLLALGKLAQINHILFSRARRGRNRVNNRTVRNGQLLRAQHGHTIARRSRQLDRFFLLVEHRELGLRQRSCGIGQVLDARTRRAGGLPRLAAAIQRIRRLLARTVVGNHLQEVGVALLLQVVAAGEAQLLGALERRAPGDGAADYAVLVLEGAARDDEVSVAVDLPVLVGFPFSFQATLLALFFPDGSIIRIFT